MVGVSITGSGSPDASNGSYEQGVIVNSSTVEDLSTGQVQINGTGGYGQAGSNYGVRIDGGAYIEAASGGVVIIGIGEGWSTSNWGVCILNGSWVWDTSTGSVTITGTGGKTGTNNLGVLIGGVAGGPNTVVWTDGSLSITGNALSTGNGILLSVGTEVVDYGTTGNAITLTGTAPAGNIDILYNGCTILESGGFKTVGTTAGAVKY